jgi:hypothetical protein
MARAQTAIAASVIALTLITPSPAGVPSGGHGGSADFKDAWILVQLQSALTNRLADGAFALDTSFPRLNAALLERGVHRIDHALSVTMQPPRRPAIARQYGLDRIYRFHLSAGSDVQTVVESFADLPEVEFAEPDYLLHPHDTIPNDPLFASQWGLHQPSGPYADADVDAPEAWDISTGGEVIIAFIDSGVDADHFEFRRKIVDGWNFDAGTSNTQDYHGHGSGVSSIAAANTNNIQGLAGVCWDCRIMPLVAGLWSAAADALVFAADNGARVVNISQGTGSPSGTFAAALAYAHDAGLVVAVSTGNDNTTPIQYPARYPETIAVGATNSADRRADPFTGAPGTGSNYGPRLDVVAPGDLVVGADHQGGYVTNLRGTSFSSPLVAGLAALVKSVYPSIGREGVRHLIRSGAEDGVGDPLEDVAGFDPYYGWGRVNLERTLLATESAVSLRLDDGQNTRVYLDTANTLADSYDFIRGNLASLNESGRGVDLGDVVCLENDSPDPDTAGNEDIVNPPLGEAFFYLARFNGAPGAGSYGGSSRNRDRRVITDDHDWTAGGDQPDGRYGISAGTAGDVNRDGFDDLIVGAYFHTVDHEQEGAAFVYLGSPSGLEDTPAWTHYGGQAGAGFGYSVATAGDVNADGFDDVIVGALYYDNQAVDEGRAYVFLGSSSGLAADPVWIADDAQQDGLFGYRVRTAGDVNDDGFDDVIVAALDEDPTGVGSARLYLGSSTGPMANPAWTYLHGQTGGRMTGAGTAGDFNGDGYDDVIVGSTMYDGGQADEGRAWLFLGSDEGPSATPQATFEVDVPDARFGISAITAGDVNNDGLDDVIISAMYYTGPEYHEGASFVYHGSDPVVATPSPDWSFETDQADASLYSAETAGDVDNDGYDDVVIASTRYDVERTDEGRVWVFRGSPSGLETTAMWSGSPGKTSAGFGWKTASAGDVNGDYNDDVVVGAYKYFENVHPGDPEVGRVFVYHGPQAPAATTDCPADAP